MRGEVNIGRVLISANAPVTMNSGDVVNFDSLACAVMRRQQQMIRVSEYHIEAGARVLGLTAETMRTALTSLGCVFWPCGPSDDALHLPASDAELWTVLLHYGHVFATPLMPTLPQWSQWLDPVNHAGDYSSEGKNRIWPSDVNEIIEALRKNFKLTEKIVETTIKSLREKGFSSPTKKHIAQYVKETNSSVPAILVHAAIEMRDLTDELSLCGESSSIDDERGHTGLLKPLFRPECGTKEEAIICAIDEVITSAHDWKNEKFGSWGYNDSGFVVDIRRDGTKCVMMKGDRYKISGNPLPGLIPFLEHESGLQIDPLRTALPVRVGEPHNIWRCELSYKCLAKLRSIVGGEEGRLSTRAIDRARHGTGHAQEDVYLIRSGGLDKIRIPDAILWPNKETEVEALVHLASEEGWCLIPFGGGTNVSHALRCPPKHDDPRPIISVDMRFMDRILWVNEEDLCAQVEAGITGSKLIHEMAQRGYTIGHEPDSVEFSTLGGWIATKASGMKRSKYGNIEDIVQGVRVVGSRGPMWQHKNAGQSAFERVSTGTDLCSIMMGSEGSFGIITSAVIKVWPIAECKEFESVVLPNFEAGIQFVHNIARMDKLKPASVRLLDNEQFRMGQALRKEIHGIRWLKEKFVKALGTLSGVFSAYDVVCVTIVFEGKNIEVELQKKVIKELVTKHGGLSAGSDIGQAGYGLTFVIAYLRDFAMSYQFLAESFETFVPWSRLREVVFATKKRIKDEHRSRSLPGNPLVSCRVTQLYDGGACVYFYFCMNFENVQDPSRTLAEIESAAREEILARGGSLSHHHGVGKLRTPFVNQVNSDSFCDMLQRVKQGIDPSNIFGAGNCGLGPVHS